MKIECDGMVWHDCWVPPFALRSGEFLHIGPLPAGMDWHVAAELLQVLAGEAEHPCIHVRERACLAWNPWKRRVRCFFPGDSCAYFLAASLGISEVFSRELLASWHHEEFGDNGCGEAASCPVGARMMLSVAASMATASVVVYPASVSPQRAALLRQHVRTHLGHGAAIEVWPAGMQLGPLTPADRVLPVYPRRHEPGWSGAVGASQSGRRSSSGCRRRRRRNSRASH